MTVVLKRSTCPFDCPDTCGLLVEVEEGRALAVKGDPEHPHSKGTLCPKMNRYQETVHSPLRLTTPLLATGPKGSGQFTPIAWTEAIQRIADRWRALGAEHGMEAILPYSYAGTMGLIQRNAGHAFFHRLGASRLDRTICSPAKAAGWAATMGQTPTPHPDTVKDSDLVILWGINALATSIHAIHGIKEAQKGGARVWLIDTYETPTAAVADRTFRVRPGSDGALALGLMHILVRDQMLDLGFIRSHVQGFQDLTAMVLPDYPPQRVAELTGLPVAAIEELAKAYGTAGAPFIHLGNGLSRYGNGAMTIRTIACLPALVGAYDGRRGAGCFTGTSTSGAFAMGQVTREDFLAAPTRVVNMNRLGHALNDLDDPRVMGLYVYHSNPAAVTPDQNAVLRGLARPDLFTVVHERFLTDTARYADLVLPATSSLEHSDLYKAYGSFCIQRSRAAIPPVGESRSNWDVFGLLAEAMGFPEPFFRQSADDLIDHLLSLPNALRQGMDTLALESGRAVELPCLSGRPPRFATPSGRVEIMNPKEPSPLPIYFPRHAEQEAGAFSLMTAPSLYGLNSCFSERDDLRARRQGMQLLMNPADAAARNLEDQADVIAFNDLGEVRFRLTTTEKVPSGVVVAEGVWWSTFAPGESTVNALTSQRLTDQGGGSTFYDNRVDVRLA
jgi:anaerobic selenocysteine-containing dehydrogenase